PHNPLILAVSFTVAGSRGDYAAADRDVRQLRAEQRESAVWQVASAAGLAWLDEVRGRLGQAARDLDAFMAVSEQRGVASSYVVGAIRRGLLDLRYRHRPLAEGRVRDAIVGYRAWTEQAENPVDGLFELATAYERARQPDSALAVYERSVAAGGVRAPLVLFDPVDARAFAATLQRLGTLY